MSIRGSVDAITTTEASGWVHAGDAGPVAVEAVFHDRVIGHAAADGFRPDLEAVGLGGGRCGFTIAFDEPIDAVLLPFVSVRPAGGDVLLPRTGIAGFVDFANGLRAANPGAGWHRSVFGGLWTDRIDARRVLAGRIAAGLVPATAIDPLLALVDGGYALLRSSLAERPLGEPLTKALTALGGGEVRKDSDEGAAVLRALPDALVPAALMPLLRCILQDNPLIYRVETAVRTTPFRQPSAIDPLPSPAECLMLIACPKGSRTIVDIVANSHVLPEFDAAGRSRWLSDSGEAIEAAVTAGAAIETIELRPSDIALVGPGTLFRVRTSGTNRPILLASISPARQTPTRLLRDGTEPLMVKAETGAMLAA